MIILWIGFYGNIWKSCWNRKQHFTNGSVVCRDSIPTDLIDFFQGMQLFRTKLYYKTTI